MEWVGTPPTATPTATPTSMWRISMQQADADATPPPPTNLRAFVSHNRINLKWTAPNIEDEVSGYRILRSLADEDLAVLVQDTGSVSTSYTDNTVTAGTEYKYAVSALISSTVSAQSGMVRARALAAPLPMPTTVPTPLALTDGNSPLTVGAGKVGYYFVDAGDNHTWWATLQANRAYRLTLYDDTYQKADHSHVGGGDDKTGLFTGNVGNENSLLDGDGAHSLADHTRHIGLVGIDDGWDGIVHFQSTSSENNRYQSNRNTLSLNDPVDPGDIAHVFLTSRRGTQLLTVNSVSPRVNYRLKIDELPDAPDTPTASSPCLWLRRHINNSRTFAKLAGKPG